MPQRIASLIVAVIATIAIVFTWANFPQIGTAHTMLAMRGFVSYGWPLCVVWLAWLATALRPPRKGLEDQLLSITVPCVASILTACWGFYVWHEMVTSPNAFYSAFLPFFAMVIGGLPVLAFYWGGMLFTLLIVLECLMRFIPGHEFLWVHDPTYVAPSYSSGGSDAGPSASSYEDGSAESEAEPTIDRSDLGDRGGWRLAARLFSSPCPECDSTIGNVGDRKCNVCHGSGIENVFDVEATLGMKPSCERCGGNGKCPRCGGSGVVDD